MKKAQGLPLNVIIIAAVALIVLVVLVAIFTGRLAIFGRGISEEAQIELARLKLSYGDCHPETAAERAFLNELSRAGDDQSAKLQAISIFEKDIKDCTALAENECITPCIWK